MDTQRLYEVRYPDGSTVLLRAYRMFTNDNTIGLRKGPLDSPGNTVFMAAISSGVTIRQIEEDAPAKAGPVGPRLCVQSLRGKQGYVLRGPFRQSDDRLAVQVQWFRPGVQPVWVGMDVLKIIPADEVERCPHGQTGDECASGENQCELCLADEDDMIERSMGLR